MREPRPRSTAPRDAEYVCGSSAEQPLRSLLAAEAAAITATATGTATAATAAPNAPAAATQHSAAQPALRIVDSATPLRREIFDPLYDACVWGADAKQWQPRNIETPLQVDEQYWKQVLKGNYPVQCALENVRARFFEAEPDPNRGNRPRLDIVLSFADGRWVRYHPKANLIYSVEPLPSQAMRQRNNFAPKLQKRAEEKRR